MELRRRRSATPRKSTTSDPYAFTARRSSRKSSMNGSFSGSNGSTSSRRNSLNDHGTKSIETPPQDPNMSGERATKRRRISVGSKSTPSHASHASHASHSTSGGSRRSSRRGSGPLPTITETPSNKKRPKRMSESTLDEIIVNVGDESFASSAIESPSAESATKQKRLPRSPASQKSTSGNPSQDDRNGNELSADDSGSPGRGERLKNDQSDLADSGGDVQNDSTKNGRPVEGDNRDSDAKDRNVDKGLKGGKIDADSQPGSMQDEQQIDPEENTQQDQVAADLQQANNEEHDIAAYGQVSQIETSQESAVQPEYDEEMDVDEDVDMLDDEEADPSDNNNEDPSQPLDEVMDQEDDGDEEDAEDGEDGEEELDEEQNSDQSKIEEEDDAVSLAGSNLDDSPTKMAVPKVITTLASPLQAVSEEDAEGVQSPVSLAADELLAAGPGKPVRKLPGRRRAPHAIPKVEAALRRQLQLRVQYRAVAKQLKPILAELAKRSLRDLKTDSEAHAKAREYEVVRKGLDDRLQARINRNKEEDKYNREKLQLLYDAEVDVLKSQYTQRTANLQADFMNQLKYDFLMAIRKHNVEEDEHASDDESGDVITARYHVNVHGRRVHQLDPTLYFSRSRKLVETEKLFDELSEREHVGDEEIPEDLETLPPKATPFTFMDTTDREANEHDRKVAALISALTLASQEKPKPPPRPPITNEEATSLQVLADAIVSGPPQIVALPSTSTRPTMASLLNAEEREIRPTAAPARVLFADNAQRMPMQQVQPVYSAQSGQQQGLLPAFSDPAGQRREIVFKQEAPEPVSLYTRSPYHGNGQVQIPGLQQRSADPNAPAANGTAGSAPKQQQATASSPTTRLAPRPSPSMQPKGSSSPEKSARRESQGALGAAKIASRGQAETPDKIPIAPTPTHGRPENPGEATAAVRRASQVDTRDQRPQEPRTHPRLMTDTTRNRSISDSYGTHAEDHFRRPSDAARHSGPSPTYYASYRDTRYDPFLSRRSTMSAMDAAGPPRFPTTTTQSSVPPHLRASNPTASSASPPYLPASSPTDRYGRPTYRDHPLPHPLQPLQLPPGPSPFASGPPPPPNFPTSLPPLPSGFPPPPPIHGPGAQYPYPGGVGAGAPQHGQPPPLTGGLRAGQYGTPYGRHPLPGFGRETGGYPAPYPGVGAGQGRDQGPGQGQGQGGDGRGQGQSQGKGADGRRHSRNESVGRDGRYYR